MFNFGPQDEFLAGLDQTIASGQAMLQAGKDLLGLQDTVMGDETQDRKRSAAEATEQDLAKLISYFPFSGQRRYIQDQKFNGGEPAQYQAINQILNKKLAEYPEAFQTRILALPTVKEQIEVLFVSARFREVMYREEPEGTKKQKHQDDDDDDLEQSMQDTMGV